MQIQVNAGHDIENDEKLIRHVETEVRGVLGHFSDQITRVEIHLSDEKAGRPGSGDKRCVMEARPAGHQPVAASHEAATLEDALNGAARKLQRLLESTLGRLHDRKGGAPIGAEEGR